MGGRWLNLYFRYSGYVFNLRQKVTKSKNWLSVLPVAVELLAAELILFVLSLPLYFAVSPNSLQQRGWIFPKNKNGKAQLQVYLVRRKISIGAIVLAVGIFAAKTFLVGVMSFYLFGFQTLLADTQDWTFDNASDYTYDAAKIEVTGGAALLKDIGGTTSGTNTNTGFNTNSTGWTYADWLNGGNAAGTYQFSGGNPGGYVRVTLNPKQSKITAGLWRQAFTTTVNAPDTATLSLDWRSITYSVPAAFDSYQLYAFIDTTSGNPTLGSEVWSSGEITGTTAWTGVTNIDITGKIPTAGTYYLKIVAYSDTPSTRGTYNTVAGFDNVVINWSKTTHVFAADRPTITPVNSLTMPKAISWDSFTETATKNGGEIYYQLSSDNGSNWQYYNGTAWVGAGASNYNTASQISSAIGSFATSTNQIKWRAFLSSSGSQQVVLDNITIGYTQNSLPEILNLTPAQNTDYGYVHVNYNLQDNNSDPESLTNYEYSLTGAFAGEQVSMTASTTDPAHQGVLGLTSSPAGVAHNFVWDAKSQLGNITSTVYVRLRANDGIGSGSYATSTSFFVDYATSTVSNVVASQILGTTTVQILYDLFDDTPDNITVELQVSGDGGSTWTVPATSVSGDVGTSVTSGNGKIIYWQAGADYANQNKSNMQVRVRAKDKFQNQGSYAISSNFSLDTLPPATLVQSDLKAQPNAGDTTVLIGGTFTEINPNINDFKVAINGADYGAATAGNSNTAAPANQVTAVGASLTGHDYISKVEIVHADDYGLSFANENLNPDVSYKYVKPYTPLAPTLSNPVTNRLDLLVNAAIGEASDLAYAIYETTQNKFVQSDGTLGNNAVWQVSGTASGQWGHNTGVVGQVRITGLSSPVANYIFKVKSRNPSDSAHAASSESAYSATAQITNTAPGLALNSYAQTTNGTRYVAVAYAGTDGQGDISSLSTYEYSTDNTVWHTLTEKAGVGSNGTTNLVFLPTGSNYSLMWDTNADLPNTEDATVYVKLRGNDTLANGSPVVSSAFAIDTKDPILTNLVASQNSGLRTVNFTYNLADANHCTVIADISADGGSTWAVATSTMTGAVGGSVTPGSNKSISWNAGTDYDNQYNANLKVRIRAWDTFGNSATEIISNAFTVDTKAPALNNISASQNGGAGTFRFAYDLAEDSGNSAVTLAISADDGLTWNVVTTSAAGDFGSAVAPGTGKTITWNGISDYNNQEKTTMKIRLTASDTFNNSNDQSSGIFSLDTKAPRVTNVSALQALGGTSVTFTYDLADQNSSLIELDISSDNGGNWTVTDTSVSGQVGTNISGGTSKTIIWNAAGDFANQNLSTMKVRVRALDAYANQSGNTESSSFSLDTLPPAVLSLAELKAQPNAGDTAALIGGSFTEAHPDNNIFSLALDGGTYGQAATGTANTALPADLLVGIGGVLDGNDYISSMRIIHTDDYGQSVSNENTSPAAAYKYVKPYTPDAPTVDNPTIGTVDVNINKNSAETNGLEYAIYETSQDKYVQSDGSLGASSVWQTLGTASGQWGNGLGLSNKVRVKGLANDSYTYQFKVKSRNTSDLSNAATSESSLSTGASSANQSPVITLNSVNQTTDGSRYVVINYTGSDLESENCHLVNYQYSTDNVVWHTMTEKAGVGSSGTTNLLFTWYDPAAELLWGLPPGVFSLRADFNFAWDTNADLPGTEDSTVYVRLAANDNTTAGNLAVSSAFTVDTKNPVITALAAQQILNSGHVSVGYNLSDLSTNTIEFNLSSDSGVSWSVATTSAAGDIGAGVVAGSSKAIVWQPLIDYPNQDQIDMQARVRAVDAFGNQSAWVATTDFAMDSLAPVVSAVSASQNSNNDLVTITYSLADTNNSRVVLGISSDNGSTWTVATSSASGDVGSGVTSGAAKTITWDAGADYSGQEISNMKVRLQAIDAYANTGILAESATFALDTKAPVLSSLVASQNSGATTFTFNYNLSDHDTASVVLNISADSGSTWVVATTTVSGAIGSGVNAGNKTISWNGDLDYANQQQSTMRLRLRASDSHGNTSDYSESADFSLDTLAPAVNVVADLKAQPQAGEAMALVGGSFTEANALANNFTVALNGGAYAATTTGSGNTAFPADQNTNTGSVLTGHDYISAVRIIETDQFGHYQINENTSPNANYKYVKPYTPATPTVNNPQNTAVDLTINAASGEASDVEYAIYETTQNKFVQSNGTLGASAVWQTIGTGAGQWGQVSTVSGKITISGLVSPVANYRFKIKSRNPSDAAHALSSESNYSSEAAISNTAPVINIISASQQLNSNYVLISYSGTDGQNDTNNLNAYEYSTDHSTWHAMTEKAGVGSSGKNNLIFSSAGSAYVFAWDAAADLPNQENLTVYVRLKSNDGITDSNLAESSAFYVDTLGPVISNINFAQAPTTGLVTISYNLNDNSGAGNDIVMSISGDGGGTWTVSTSTLSGDVGSGVTAGANRQATWQAFTDYSGQENNTIKIKIFGLDKYGNSGSSTVSDNFTLDTKAPAVSSVSASQISGTGNVLINYTLADLTSAGHLVEFGVSADNGGTWAVATSTVSGSIGAGQSVGAKSFTWQASTDYSGYDVTNMKIRVRAKDYFGNQSGFISSASFSLDTKAPVISNISATQQGGSDLFTVNYDLDDQATTTLNISSDGGLTWAVSTLSAAGDLGNNLAAGVNKSISWNGAADYIDHENSNMRARLKATDSHGNASIYYESANFALDTAAPLNLIALNKFGTNNNNVTLTWPVASDANFSHYELWHGANENDVINQTSTANLWGVVNDANLSNVLTISTTITGLNLTSSYFVRIWAVDNFGHRAAANQINVFTQPVSTPTPAATPVQTAGGMAYLPDSTAPIKPLLNPVVSPSQNPILEISGLSEPGSRLELYDNDSLLAGFSATAAANGAFQQSLNLIQGSHRLKVRAYDAAGNVSEFSDSISVDIIFGVAAPLIISPKTEENVTDTNPTIFGVSIPFATINIILDSGQKFTASADGLGAWNFKLPTTLALSNGQHNFVITASDQAGNVSLPTNLALTKTTLAATAGIGIQTPAPVSPITPTPLAPSELISQNAEAIELPGLPLPKVNLVQIPAASSDIITFSGTALPNQDVIVYVHSSQALIYRTRTDGQGNWRVDHSQKLMALAPGDHTVFAVTLDAAAKVKSRPSAISIFTVKRNLWVQIFNYLNLQTTIVALAVMLLTWLWLYRSRKTLLSKGIS